MPASAEGRSTTTGEICQFVVGKLRTLKRRSSCGSGRSRTVQSPRGGRARRRSSHSHQQAFPRAGASTSNVDSHVSQEGLGGSGNHTDFMRRHDGSDSHAAPIQVTIDDRMNQKHVGGSGHRSDSAAGEDNSNSNAALGQLHESKFPRVSSIDRSSRPAFSSQDGVLVGAGGSCVAAEATALTVAHHSASTRMVWIHCPLDSVSLQCGPAACLSGTDVAMFSTQMMEDCRASTPRVNVFTMLWLMEQRQTPDACPQHRACAWVIAGQMEVPPKQRCFPFGELDGLSSAYSDRSCTPWLSSREAAVRSITRLPLALWLHRRASEPERKQSMVRQAASI